MPVLFLESLFERTEIKDLIAVLLLLVDRRAMGLIRTACWPEFAMALEDAVRIFERLRGAEAQPVRGGKELRTSLEPGWPPCLP